MVSRPLVSLVALHFTCLLLLVTLVLPAYGMQITPDGRKLRERVSSESAGGIGGVLHSANPIAGPVTVMATLVFAEDWDPALTEEIWLVGLSAKPDEAALGLSVVWSEVDAGWFPFWKLQLHRQYGDRVERLDLATVTPEPGHIYVTTLSFDPGSGGGALHVMDQSTGQTLYAGGCHVEAAAASLYPVAGVVSGSDGATGVWPKVTALDVYDAYVPLGSKAELASESNPTVPLVRAVERDEALLLRLLTPGALPTGEFWLRTRHHDTGATERLGPIEATSQEMILPFPLLNRPGQVTVTFEYVSDGHCWFSSSSAVSIGWLSVEFAGAQVHHQEAAVKLQMRLQSDAVREDIPLQVRAVLRCVARDPETKRLYSLEYPPRTVFSDFVAADAEPRNVSLAIPLPETTSFGVWQITLHAQSESSIDLRRFGTAAIVAVAGVAADPLAVSGPIREARPQKITLEEEARLRQAAAWRTRRIMFNNDGGDARAPSAVRTLETFLRERTTPLLGSQVDTIIYDTTAGTFGCFAHWTEIGHIFLTQEGRYGHNMTPQLIMQETDPLQVMIDFSREHDLEIFWTMRMNDTHDASNELLLPDLKKKHPELLFGSPTSRPPYGAWSGVDYGDPRIRELAFRYVEEVADNYDVDGILLDFFRHSVLFKRAAWGEPLGEKELDALTELMTRMRERLRQLGAIRGQPILLAVRVPDSIEYCQAIGIDLERWLAEGLIDMLVPGGYFRLSRWEDSVELGRQYGVPVYPSLDESRVEGIGTAGAPDPDRGTLEAYRGRAMNVWQAGAAGVHLFNMFSPSHPMLREIGSPGTLAGKEKVYFVSVRGNAGAADTNRNVAQPRSFFRVPVLTPASPQVLWGDTPLVLSIDVGEDLEAARRVGLHPMITLRLCTEGLPDAQGLQVKLNGHALSHRKVESLRVEYTVDSSWLCQGSNWLELRAWQEGNHVSHVVWPVPPVGRSAIGITEFEVSTPSPQSLRLRVRAEATGEATIGSVSIRTPNKDDRIPPGFDVVSGGYHYPRGWASPGFSFHGPYNEESHDDQVFAITLPMADSEPGEYVIQLFVTNRPAPGAFINDSRQVLFRIDERGRVQLPSWRLCDVQLRVCYDK